MPEIQDSNWKGGALIEKDSYRKQKCSQGSGLDEMLPLRKRLETLFKFQKASAQRQEKIKRWNSSQLWPHGTPGAWKSSLVPILQLAAPAGTAGNKESLQEPGFNWTQAQIMGRGHTGKWCRQSTEPRWSNPGKWYWNSSCPESIHHFSRGRSGNGNSGFTDKQVLFIKTNKWSKFFLSHHEVFWREEKAPHA